MNRKSSRLALAATVYLFIRGLGRPPNRAQRPGVTFRSSSTTDSLWVPHGGVSTQAAAFTRSAALRAWICTN